MSSNPFYLITRQTELEAFLRRIEPVDEIALDTEADNMYHYRNRICLFQVRAEDEIVLIDPLSNLKLDSFFERIREKALLMHGSDFDLRLMFERIGFSPLRLFDTMLAAQLLGRTKIGLGSLVEDYCEVSLPKGHQKSDWSQRPLPGKMLLYAAQDVQYLFEIKETMQKELEERGRMEWFRQRCQWQIEVGALGFGERDEHSWRIPGSRTLAGRGLACLYELWTWRERAAEKADLPPFKILNNPYLLEIAKAVEKKKKPTDDWHKVVPPKILGRHGAALEKAVERGFSLDPSSLQRKPRSPVAREPLSKEELQRQDLIKEARDDCASELGIDAALIANRAQLILLSRKPETLDQILLPWQAELLREAVSELSPGS
ncbi:MAG: HRDC domain-containing protein [Opitutales bacterium]